MDAKTQHPLDSVPNVPRGWAHSSVHQGSQRAGEQGKIARNAYPYKVGLVSLDLLSTDVFNQTWVIRHLVDDKGDYPGAKRIRSYEEDGINEQGGKAVGIRS